MHTSSGRKTAISIIARVAEKLQLNNIKA